MHTSLFQDLVQDLDSGILHIFKLFCSIFCSPTETHGRQTPGLGYPHAGQRRAIVLLLQVGSDPLLERWVACDKVVQPVCSTGLFAKLGLGRASSDSGAPSLTLGNLLALFCAQIPTCKTRIMLLPFFCLFGSLVSRVSDIPAEIRAVLCYSNRNKLGASEIQPPRAPLAFIAKPSSSSLCLRVTSRRQTRKQARQKIDCVRFVVSPGEAQDN